LRLKANKHTDYDDNPFHLDKWRAILSIGVFKDTKKNLKTLFLAPGRKIETL